MPKEVMQPIFSEEEQRLKSLADPDCSKCFGKGNRGIKVAERGFYGTPTPIPCKCTTLAERRLRNPETAA